MIRFYYRADLQSTQEKLVDAIREELAAGKDVLLLVPEQHTVSTERRMLAALPMSAQLHFEVVNFSRLANRVFRTLGGHSFALATPAVKALTMWRTLRDLAPMLVQYGKHAEEMRLCELMLQTAERCRAYRISAEELLRVAECLPENEPLRGKLTDLGTVIGAFEATLGERFDNTDEELDRLAALLRQHGADLFSSTAVFVDSFTDFTAQELEVLRELMRAAHNLCVTFPLSHAGDSGLHLASPAATHRHLLRMANELGLPVSYQRTEKTPPHSARGYLAEHLFDMTAEPAPLAFMEESDVSLFRCADPFSQAEAAVAEIHRLVRAGCRYRDIAVVLRDATQSVGILDAAMERDGIPFFLSEKTDVTVRPLVKLILLSLRICLYGWRHEDVIAYLKTGLCGVLPDDVNLLEEYARVWTPRGEGDFSEPFTKNPDGYTIEKSERAAEILAGANRARASFVPPLLTLFSDLRSAENAEQMCRALYRFLTELRIAEQMKDMAARQLQAGERREAEELSRLYTVTVQALEDLCAAMGELPLSIAELHEALKLIFARTDIGTIPTSSDEVMIGSASMLRTDHPRHVLVLGLNEGEFPRAVGDDGLISDTEMLRLATDYGLEFPSGRAERASDELFYVYRAFRAPAETLSLFYTAATSDGRACTPSIAFERATALLPTLKVIAFESQSPENTVYTPDAAIDRLGEFPAEQRAELLAMLDDYPVKRPRALDVPVTDDKATVAPETATKLFEGRALSPSQLESFSRCQFSYFCEKILALRPEKKGALSLADTGTFLHYVLEGVMLGVKKADKPFSDWKDEERNALIANICKTYLDDLAANGAPLTPRAASLMDRLTTLAELVVSNLFEEFSDSSFVPALTEFDLKDLRSSSPTTVNAPYIDEFGDEIPYSLNKVEDPHDEDKTPPLAGKVDRIDLWRRTENTAYLRVVDYKTGTRKFSTEDIKHGYSLQMPLYLKELCASTHSLLYNRLHLPYDTKLQPAGVTYFSTAISSDNTPKRQDADTALAAAKGRLERSGVLLGDRELLAAASHSVNLAVVGTAKGKKHLSAEEFEQMFEDLEATLSTLTGNMKAGCAAAAPNRYGDNDPCKFCSYATVCRARKQEKGDDD